MTRLDLLTNPMTTAADLIKGGASGTPERLAIGSAGQVLTVAGGVPAWEDPGSGGKYDPDASPATAAAIAEEFDEGALSSGWAWGTPPNTTEDYTSYPGYGYFVHTTGNHWLSKAWVPGATDLTIAAALRVSRFATNNADAATVMLGVADATGTDPSNGVFSTVFPKAAADSTFALYNRNAGSFANAGSDVVLFGKRQNLGKLYLMLQRTNTGPVWRAYLSWDGITWMQHASTGSKALTVGAVSLRISDQADIVAVDWIRAWNSLITKVGA